MITEEERQRHIENGDPQCPCCDSFQVEPVVIPMHARGRPHREEYYEEASLEECQECGVRWQPGESRPAGGPNGERPIEEQPRCDCWDDHAIADVTEASCGCPCHRSP